MTPVIPVTALEALWAFDAIELDELQADAALRTRVDRKYMLDWDTFTSVARTLRGSHRALEIDGGRAFRYETVYFDSARLGAFRAHMQRRRRRYKVRSRRYVDSDLHFFEIKLKGARGETIKHQLPYGPDDHGLVTDAARAFLADQLSEAYPRMDVPALAPTVITDYRRLTLAGYGERVTVDFGLRFSDEASAVDGLDRGHVILESKCERGLGAADRQLRRLGVAPVTCSKYCVGIGLLRDDVKVNDLRWLLSRYFHAHA
jgi:hypothetical protein